MRFSIKIGFILITDWEDGKREFCPLSTFSGWRPWETFKELWSLKRKILSLGAGAKMQ